MAAFLLLVNYKLTKQQSHEAGAVVKQQGGRNDLLERIKKNEFFKVRPAVQFAMQHLT
jgi:hypothetical protein